ncbi:hypothetical protein NA78x_005336 [Anatilimnocola sp. NA78]|uniref:hypothetical protein n=1 Tax=Anatilimnocola sp. NA78 TaxID=3415683 RepID=UPI003CE540A6
MLPDALNPYQSPAFAETGERTAGGQLSAAIFLQQRVICILMIVQGALCLMMGVGLIFAAFTLPVMIVSQQQGDKAQMEMMRLTFMVTYGIMASCGLLSGGLQVYAGIRNLWLRGYVLGIVALVSGLLSAGTCYCLPTGMAIMIYGLIIYLNPSTKLAFELVRQGLTVKQVRDLANGTTSG